MLRGVKGLHGSTLHALDGEVGRVDEILFDDAHWTVRYLVVKTGSWLFGRKVLISPVAFGPPDWERQTLNVNLTREQIKNSPGVDTDRPVSRQWERNYYDYYAWPYYWSGMGTWGSAYYPGALLPQPVVNGAMLQQEAADQAREHADAHLRSTRELTGYGISATDGHLGHVQDFLINEETWRICYLVVDTRNWWPGKKVLLPPAWIGQVNWPDDNVTVNLTREQVRNAPEWDPGKTSNRDCEDHIHTWSEDRLSGEDTKSNHVHTEFRYQGHRVQVSHENVPEEWLGDFDTVFTVIIDGNKTVVPGIWKAYQTDGEEGVTLVIQAFLDVAPLLI